MKKSVLLLVFILLICKVGSGQNFTDYKFGKSQGEIGQKCIVKDDSTLWLMGWGQKNSFVLYKVKTNGDTIFCKYLNLPFFTQGIDLLECPNGDLILIGSNGGLVKTDKLGNMIWSVHNKGVSQAAGVLVNDTAFAVAGQRPVFSHIALIPDKGPDSVFYNDIYIGLYNLTGNLLKNLTYSFVNDNNEACNDIIYTSGKELVILGNSYFNRMPNEFMLTMDLELSVKLDTLYSYPGIYIGNSILENSRGNYIIAGHKYTSSTNDFDILIQEIKPDGTFLWEKTYDLNGLDVAGAVIESDGYYYLSGNTANKRNAAQPYSDAILLKHTLTGDTLWTKTYKLPGSQCTMDVQEVNANTLALLGYTNHKTAGGADFHLILCSKENGFSDLDRPVTGPVINNKPDEIKVFPNPTSGEVTISGDDILTVTFRNSVGKVIKKSSPLKPDQKFSVLDFEKGIYFISIETNKGVTNRRLIIL